MSEQHIAASSTKHKRTPGGILVASISGATGGLAGLALTGYLTDSIGALHPILRIVIMSIFGATGGLLGVYFARQERDGRMLPLALVVGVLSLLGYLLFAPHGTRGINYLLAATVSVGAAAVIAGVSFVLLNLARRRTTHAVLASVMAVLGVAAVVFSLLGLGMGSAE